MGKIYFIILVSIFSSFSFAVDHQHEISKAQKWADSFNKPYPIVIVDRDKTNFLIKSQKASEDEEKSFTLIKEYFQKESGVSISKNDYINLEPYIKTLTNSAIALPITEGFSADYKFCVVFANAPNGNAQVESNRIVGFNQEEAFKNHPHLNYNNLNDKMSFEELYLFSLYHEVGHCLDEMFLVELQKNGADPHGVHEAEAFAELLAYFALIPRLGKEVAARRGVYRTVYSRVIGGYLTTRPSLGDPNVTSGGAIYNLGPYLYKAQELLLFQKIALDQPLDNVAKEFVFKHVMTSREFQSVVSFLRDGREKANAQYSDWVLSDPQFFYSAYMELLHYQGYTDTVLEYGFTLRAEPEYEELPGIDKNLLCQALEDKDQKDYLKVLNDYRSVINEGIYEPALITKTYTKLNNLDFKCL